MKLSVLLIFVPTVSGVGTDSLNCNLNVRYRKLHGECSVNGKPLLHFDDGKQEGNAPEVCADLSQSLKDTLGVMQSLQSGNDALNVVITSQCNQGKFIDGFWTFNTDENHSIYFYPLNKNWRESHSDASDALDQWKNSKEIEKGLRNVLMGDFSDCLMKLLTDSGEMPTLSTTSTHVDPPSSQASTSKPSALVIMLSCLLCALINCLLHVF